MRMLTHRKTARQDAGTGTRHAINAERVHDARRRRATRVRVMRGEDKGKEGKILRVFPKTGRVTDRGREHREEAPEGAPARGAERDHGACRRRSTRRT